MTTPFLEVDALTKRFGATVAVEGVSLAVSRGEILALLGPSGSGKTTTLRLLAGFEQPDGGRVLVQGADVTTLAPVRRRFGMVFQHYALFPHLDVGENVAFGLESQGLSADRVKRRVTEALAAVDHIGFERRRVAALSGGQQQRVALARALAPEPAVLLLDEPLSNLDPTLRERTRAELRDLIRRVGITTVLVTHEQDEAFDLADRVAVLRRGRLEQIGTPDHLYLTPANAFVATFVGRASSVPATLLQRDANVARIKVEHVEWSVPLDTASAGMHLPPGEAMLLARPEALWLTGPVDGALRGTVTHRRFAGASSLYTVVTLGGAALEVSAPPTTAAVGDVVGVLPSRRAGGGLHLFPRTGL